MSDKTKAALQGRLSHFSNFTENSTTLIDQVNARRFAHIFSNYGKSPQSLTMGAATGKSLKALRVTGSHAQISFGRLATIGTYTKNVGGWVSLRGYEIFVGHPFGSSLSDGGIPPSVTAAMARLPTVLQICNSLIAGGMRHCSTPQSPRFSGDLQSPKNSADT